MATYSESEQRKLDQQSGKGVKPLHELSDDARLKLLEVAHHSRCGTERLFCYVETHWIGDLYRLSFVEEDEPGHFPITEDLFSGGRDEMAATAARLNRTRLGLTGDRASMIVASSMSGDVERRRRRS